MSSDPGRHSRGGPFDASIPQHERGSASSPVITQERPDTPDALALIAELEGHLDPLYPSESRHGYSVEKLLREGVAFFVMRENGEAAGCGGVQLFGTEYGELKRMYVRPQFRGLGLGKMMLEHLAAHALRNGVGFTAVGDGDPPEGSDRPLRGVWLQARSAVRRVQGPDPLSIFYEKQIA